MKSKASKSFWRLYYALPIAVQQQAQRAHQLWRENPSYPALQFKQVKQTVPPLYSVRIMNTGYRALGELEGDIVTWRWIGPHDEYLRLLR